MASPGYDVSTSCVILIPQETSARQRKWVSARLKERARARATSCWSWVWGEDRRERQNEDPQLELGTFAVIKADPGQVFWSAQVLALNLSAQRWHMLCGERGEEVGKGKEGMPRGICKSHIRLLLS